MRRLVSDACVLILLGACTASDADPVDRLVVLDGENRVVTMAPDGSDEVVVSEEGDAAFQPIWSPDGLRIAYATTSGDPDLVVVDVDSGDVSRTGTATGMFYFHWSPASDRLATLRNTARGLAFESATVGEGTITVTLVDEGQPYYFDWHPDGERLIVHVGTDRLDLVEPGEDPEPIGVSPGPFAAPQWTAGGIVSVTAEAGGPRLAIVDEGGGSGDLAQLAGASVFGADDDADRIAVQSFVPDGGSVTAALAEEPLAADRLQVVEVATGEVTEITDALVAAFSWDPTGERLLLLEGADDPGRLTWSVWEGGEVTEGPTFSPAVSWVRDFLPFHDQYARSMTLWSPDGSAFAFPGRIGEEEGVWVHDLGDGSTDLVSDGTWVAWTRS